MLAMSEAAAGAICVLAAQEGVAGHGGLRCVMHTVDEAQAALALSVAPAPVVGDHVVTGHDGAQLFVEPRAAQYLAGKVLDLAPDGEGRMTFALVERR